MYPQWLGLVAKISRPRGVTGNGWSPAHQGLLSPMWQAGLVVARVTEQL